MRYSFMTFSCPTATWEEVLGLARRFGYDGVEPRIESGHGHGVEIAARAEKRREIRKRAEESRVAIACVATGWKLAALDSSVAPECPPGPAAALIMSLTIVR